MIYLCNIYDMLGASLKFLENLNFFQALFISELRGAAIEENISETFKRIIVDVGLFSAALYEYNV